MRVLLLSTYELGRQPIHLASPAASLTKAGHNVKVLDLSVDQLDSDHLKDVDAIGISVPMHTAKRLADSLSVQVKSIRPGLPIAHYGLYASAGDGTTGADVLIEGEYEPALIKWVASLAVGEPFPETTHHTGKSDFSIPLRTGLQDLGQYARLEHDGKAVVAGAVEASHGCRHRCRHCPIPAVYDGRMRVVPAETVLADMAQLVDLGAGHVTFGDPDFLNAPRHSMDLLREANARFPDLTFDITVKVEHIVHHAGLWTEMAKLGVLFVVSAFESVDEETLEILDKGHSVADMREASQLIRGAGIHIRPTWLPFMPWTQTQHLIDLVEFLDSEDLTSATDPVQLAIKLLIPRGSLLENHPSVVPFLEGYDPGALTWQWRFEHPDVEFLHKELENVAAEASDCGQETHHTLTQMRNVLSAATARTFPPLSAPSFNVPRLSESWFCCAEPTAGQTVSLRMATPR
ncbi:MAG: radical SAM protein [Acidimicrobiia bacterium]